MEKLKIKLDEQDKEIKIFKIKLDEYEKEIKIKLDEKE